jgi:hypothetical protein
LDRVLGLVMLAVYILAVVGLAAAITWAVVRIFPTESNSEKPPDEKKKQPQTNDSQPAGRLFRRAKRGEAPST